MSNRFEALADDLLNKIEDDPFMYGEGWDVVYEAWSVCEIADALRRNNILTLRDAVRYFHEHEVAPHVLRRAEARAFFANNS